MIGDAVIFCMSLGFEGLESIPSFCKTSHPSHIMVPYYSKHLCTSKEFCWKVYHLKHHSWKIGHTAPEISARDQVWKFAINPMVFAKALSTLLVSSNSCRLVVWTNVEIWCGGVAVWTCILQYARKTIFLNFCFNLVSCTVLAPSVDFYAGY